jgi:hypothetical protein
VVADVAEALDDDAFPLETAVEPCAPHVFGVSEERLEPVLNTAPGCLDASADSSHLGWLARDTGFRVDVVGVQRAVGIGDPGHFPLSCSHVWSGDVLARTDVALLVELDREVTGDGLDLLSGVRSRVDAEAPL